MIAIPVCLVGALAALFALGFSINTLTLFGMVLAVGLVVDDAIVVVENVSRHLEEHPGIDPKEAARNAMAQVTGPIVATSLVLMAVFVPVAFTPGVTGQFYRQFALTIACAVGISAFLALSLSPALCAALLRHHEGPRNWLSRKFDAGFKRLTGAYEKTVGWVSRFWVVIMTGFVVLLGATVYIFTVLPTGFIPEEDQGYLIVSVKAPEGTSLERTEEIVKRIQKLILETPGVKEMPTFAGFDLITGTSAPNVASMFPVMKPWDERTAADEQLLTAILPSIQAKLAAVPDAIAVAFNPPPIMGLSTTGGFQFELQDYEGGKLSELEKVTNRVIEEARKRPELTGLFTTFSADTPTYFVDIDRTKALSQGISLNSIFTAMQSYLGAYYVNDFNKFGRVFRVFVQAEGDQRNKIEDVSNIYVRNGAGDMVPLSSVVTLKPQLGARIVSHYNLFRAAAIMGAAAPGFSSNQAIQAMEEVAADVLPDSMGYEWTATAYQELKAGNVAPYIFALALVMVFLFLAAQYESWAMPFMVILAVPLAIFGALGAQWLRGLDNDIYTQVGLVMLIGLASKNAILIVEFARRRRDEDDMSIEMAAMEAARVRLRPILMTAFAFILGVLPLVLATGAGANARHSLGTAVFRRHVRGDPAQPLRGAGLLRADRAHAGEVAGQGQGDEDVSAHGGAGGHPARRGALPPLCGGHGERRPGCPAGALHRRRDGNFADLRAPTGARLLCLRDARHQRTKDGPHDGLPRRRPATTGGGSRGLHAHRRRRPAGHGRGGRCLRAQRGSQQVRCGDDHLRHGAGAEGFRMS